MLNVFALRLPQGEHTENGADKLMFFRNKIKK